MASQVIPICLPWNAGDPTIALLRESTSDENVVIAGWGKITNDRSRSRESYSKYSVAVRTLQKVSLPLQSMEDCRSTFDDVNQKIMFCSGGMQVNIVKTKDALPGI